MARRFSCRSIERYPTIKLVRGSIAVVALTAPALAQSYTLSADELALDCKKLTGRMQVRILSARSYDAGSNSTAAARTLQSGGRLVFGGTREGVDPVGQHGRDRSMLDAYNRQLAAKGCRTFDLDRELSAGGSGKTPSPVAPQRKKP